MLKLLPHLRPDSQRPGLKINREKNLPRISLFSTLFEKLNDRVSKRIKKEKQIFLRIESQKATFHARISLLHQLCNTHNLKRSKGSQVAKTTLKQLTFQFWWIQNSTSAANVKLRSWRSSSFDSPIAAAHFAPKIPQKYCYNQSVLQESIYPLSWLKLKLFS